MRGRKPILNPNSHPITSAPKAPSWLGKAARAEWRRIAPLLMDRRILAETDLTTLAHYCAATGLVEEQQKTINREGSLVMTERGPRAHPAVRIQADAMNRARLIGGELGLSPTSRNRPAIRTDQEDDDSASDLGV